MTAIACPQCHELNQQVISTRETNAAIRRRRECSCGYRFTTYERISNYEASLILGVRLPHLRGWCPDI